MKNLIIRQLNYKTNYPMKKWAKDWNTLLKKMKEWQISTCKDPQHVRHYR